MRSGGTRVALLLNENPATGGPASSRAGREPTRTASGTAYSNLSHVWFTISRGTINEVSFPTIDRPQIRDFQFLVTDGATFLHDGRRGAHHTTEYLDEHALGYRITTHCPEGRYTLVREIIGDAHRSCLLIRTRLEAPDDLRDKLKLYALLAPHLDVGGWGNNGNVVRTPAGQCSHGQQERPVAGHASLDPASQDFVRICRRDRRLAGFGPRLPHGLAIRFGDRRQYRLDGAKWICGRGTIL